MNDDLSAATYSPQIPQNNASGFENINQGTIAIEASRAVAEAQGKLIIAKKFPRDEISSYAQAMQSCQRRAIADKAFYKYPRGSSSVEGPTIRFAEELARCWGNLDFGIKELSQDEGKSEMQAYCWDLETNVISVQNFTNPHMRDEGGKTKKLTALRDIYEVNANMASRRLRARILAILPSDFVENAITECRKTLLGKNDTPLIDRVKALVVTFNKFGVTSEQIENRLKRKIDTMNADDFVEYVGIYNALKDGASKVSEWFDTPREASELTQSIMAEIEDGTRQ